MCTYIFVYHDYHAEYVIKHDFKFVISIHIYIHIEREREHINVNIDRYTYYTYTTSPHLRDPIGSSQRPRASCARCLTGSFGRANPWDGMKMMGKWWENDVNGLVSGKILTGNHGFYHEISEFPVNFVPSNFVNSTSWASSQPLDVLKWFWLLWNHSEKRIITGSMPLFYPNDIIMFPNSCWFNPHLCWWSP